MSTLRSHSMRMMESYVETSAANRDHVEELRRLASLDREQARALDDWHMAVQDWTLAANACFELLSLFRDALNHYLYEVGGPYDAGLEIRLIEGYRKLVEESEQLRSDMATLQEKGRPVEGVERYESYLRQACDLLEDDAIRKRAESLIPGVEKLDALARAHIRSAEA